MDLFLKFFFAWLVGAPALLGLCLLIGIKIKETIAYRVVMTHAMGIFLTSLYFLLTVREPLDVHIWRVIEKSDYEWEFIFYIDIYSICYLFLTGLIYPLIVKFSKPSFHREEGYERYWIFISSFGAAISLVSIAGNMDTFCIGWEIVALCSVMLISFFRSSIRSNENSLRALVYYRICDFFILASSAFIHHVFPDAKFSAFDTDASLPYATLIGILIVLGSLAKSAQLPMTPWFHRAMEGPSASSTIFYGALSVHLGAFLLLRTHMLWAHDPWVASLVMLIGFSTAVFATFVGRTRVDAKTSLAYATMTQVGLIYFEIGLGFTNFALFHMMTHAALRTWQFLRSTSLIQDFQDNRYLSIGAKMGQTRAFWGILPNAFEKKLYLLALREFWIDSFERNFFLKPFRFLFVHLPIGVILPKTHLGLISLYVGFVGLGFLSHFYTLNAYQNILQPAFMILAFFATGFSLFDKSPMRVLFFLGLSQCFLAFAGNLLGDTAHDASNIMLLSGSLGFLSLMEIVRQIAKQKGITTVAPDHGLAKLAPLFNRYFLLIGWLLVGAPGGGIFFAEDLHFHSLLEYSKLETAAFLFSCSLNTISFYRVYVGLFSGPLKSPNEKPLLHHPCHSVLFVLSTGVMFALGVCPSLVF